MRVAVIGVVIIGIVGVESFTGSGTRIRSSNWHHVIWGGNRASNGVCGDTLSMTLSSEGIRVVKMSVTDVESTVKTGQKLDKVSDEFTGGSVGLVICVVRIVTVVYCVFMWNDTVYYS